MSKFDGLRKIADMLDEAEAAGLNPGMPNVYLWAWSKGAKELTKLIAREIGTFKKEYTGSTLSLESDINGIHFNFRVERDAVCQRVETEVVIPAKTYPATEEFTIPERVEKKVEWVCTEPLLA